MKTFDLKEHLNYLPKEGRILVAPLDWGIGHATRCIPIIRQLIENGFSPIIASSAQPLILLQKIFPNLESVDLPAYDVRYAKNSKLFTLKLLLQTPRLIKTYKSEKKIIDKLVRENKIDALISDNRFGVFHKKIPSIYITHQLRVLSGIFTFLTTYFHQRITNKYDLIWVPDVKETPNLSGDLSHPIKVKNKIKYIGILSQFHKEDLAIKYDILLLLSGPEPQRSLLEKKLVSELSNSNKRICLVQGIVQNAVEKTTDNNITTYNYLFGLELQKIINESKLIVARSGYSTIMDLAKLKKRAFFIPTPGQAEQIYLAEHLKKQQIAPYCLQNNFHSKLLNTIADYKGF